MADRTYVDFETASALSVVDVNASNYAQHPTTHILCAVFRRNGQKLRIIGDLSKDKDRVMSFIKGSVLVAHNAQFEICIWKHILAKKHGYPDIDFRHWRCSMAKASAHALYRNLEGAADMLGLLQQKDMGGKALMLKMCKLDGPRDAQSFIRLMDYCAQDTATCEALDKELPDLTPYEQKVWELDQKINFRGVKLDIPLVDSICGLLTNEKESLLEEFTELTEGKVPSPDCRDKLRAWFKDNGLDLPNMQAGTIAKIKKFPNDKVSRVIQIRSILAKKSVSKFFKMQETVETDGRLRMNLIYHGASTGRWTGSEVQLQNLVRPKLKVALALSLLIEGRAATAWRLLWGSIAETASSVLRSMIVPSEGKAISGADFAGIEARILPWVAGQYETLNIFREGRDIYCEEATTTFGRIITKLNEAERQVGKCQVLGLGYQGGIAAFQKMCQIYRVSLGPIAKMIWGSATPDEKDKAEYAYKLYLAKHGDKEDVLNHEEGLCADILKQRWREKNGIIVKLWKATEEAALNAVKNPRQSFKAGKVAYQVRGRFLYCDLPSGRSLAYFQPTIVETKTPTGRSKETVSFLAIDGVTKQIVRVHAYGGLWVENIVQAIGRDIMVCGMFNVENAGYEVIVNVHDEVVSEVPPGLNPSIIEDLMTRPIEWCLDLPLKVEAWVDARYRK